MTTTLDVASQLLMDLYYQDYAPANAWLDLVRARMLFAAEYNRLIREDFKNQKFLAKTQTGYSVVEIDPEWLVSETVKLSRDGATGVATLSQKIFSFDYDVLGSGVQLIDGACNLVRISIQDKWAIQRVPATKTIYWYIRPSVGADDGTGGVKTSLWFIGADLPNKVDVFYVPSVNESNGDAPINESKMKPVIDACLQTLFIAKQQVVVDKSDDGNPNANLATEINPDLKR